MLFEVPYNFDEKLLHFYKKNKSYISYIYLPPFKDDSPNTRTSIQTNIPGRCYMPQTRSEYERHLNLISEIGLRFVVLWQLRDLTLSQEMLSYYCNLNTSGFIVANEQNAEIIKKYNSKLLTICSIVQKSCANIKNKDLSNYDYVVLYYTFNRGLDAIKQLGHIKDKIILMPNSLCDHDCPSTHHWFPSKDKPFDSKKDCSMSIKTISRCSLIFPEHLYLFDNYVGGYKLQGREYATDAIKHLCHFYFKRTKYDGFVNPFLSTNMSSKLKQIINDTPIEKYYNTKTNDILKVI